MNADITVTVELDADSFRRIEAKLAELQQAMDREVMQSLRTNPDVPLATLVGATGLALAVSKHRFSRRRLMGFSDCET